MDQHDLMVFVIKTIVFVFVFSVLVRTSNPVEEEIRRRVGFRIILSEKDNQFLIGLMGLLLFLSVLFLPVSELGLSFGTILFGLLSCVVCVFRLKGNNS